MNLDFKNLKVAREKLGESEGRMDFLFDRIRRELETRIKERQTNAERALVIDFDNGNFRFVGAHVVEQFSLLEQPSLSKPLLVEHEDQSFDAIVVIAQTSWLDFSELLDESVRVLRPGGMFYFTAFGPETLAELGYAWHLTDVSPHMHELIDMHFLGDALVKRGLQKPIVDTDWLTVEYPTVETLLDDLKDEGFVNLREDRRKVLTGRERFDQFKKALWDNFNRDNVLPISFEIIYGFGQVPENTTAVRVMAPTR